jgi:hypothetical protein
LAPLLAQMSPEEAPSVERELISAMFDGGTLWATSTEGMSFNKGRSQLF